MELASQERWNKPCWKRKRNPKSWQGDRPECPGEAGGRPMLSFAVRPTTSFAWYELSSISPTSSQWHTHPCAAVPTQSHIHIHTIPTPTHPPVSVLTFPWTELALPGGEIGCWFLFYLQARWWPQNPALSPLSLSTWRHDHSLGLLSLPSSLTTLRISSSTSDKAVCVWGEG